MVNRFSAYWITSSDRIRIFVSVVVVRTRGLNRRRFSNSTSLIRYSTSLVLLVNIVIFCFILIGS